MQIKKIRLIFKALVIPFILLNFSLHGINCRPSGSKDSSLKKSFLINLWKEELKLEDEGDFTGAIEVCQKILLLEPNNAPVLTTIAGLYGKLGEFKKEIVWAKKAITADQKYYNAYINYGDALGETGKIKEAGEKFSKAIQLDPKNPLGYYSKGVLEEQQGKMREALGFYQKSVQLDSNFESGWYSLAAVCANLKQFDEAIAALNKVIALNPNAKDARGMLEQVQKDQEKSTR